MANEITYQIDAFLQDNSLTKDNTEDVYAVPASREPADEERILAEMKAEDTGLRPETILHVFELEKRVIKRLLMTGHAVNTGLYHASVAFRGLVKNSTWNPDENQIAVNFNPGADLREAIRQTRVNILGPKPAGISVTGMEDVATKAIDASATAGRAFTLSGQNIRINGDDPSVGLTLTDEDGTETKVTQDLWVINNPSKVTFIIPAGLTAGTYTLRLTTQYGGNSQRQLKAPRTVEKTLYIGTQPPSTGGGSGSEEEGSEGSFG
ncbi:MAG TPA: DUF4469 domain-containing protein [Candidatus Bacteroides intestinavium]|uniref:DUF4469 domain-containing protein n=1 Tax=Candidatus Bacteroides intestinavium TaxID=2838469 RepID=A0A9D2HTY0_9BACE|nr:DUF4469 domain-containing protein [Candidatus Bacteroides intestinavium]